MAFAPSASWNSRSITHLANYLSPSLPMIFSDESLYSQRKPIQLTSSPLSLGAPMPSTDGKKIFVVGRIFRGESMRYDLKADRFTPFLGGISAEYFAYSKDGQWLTYVSYP